MTQYKTKKLVVKSLIAFMISASSVYSMEPDPIPVPSDRMGSRSSYAQLKTRTDEIAVNILEKYGDFRNNPTIAAQAIGEYDSLIERREPGKSTAGTSAEVSSSSSLSSTLQRGGGTSSSAPSTTTSPKRAVPESRAPSLLTTSRGKPQLSVTASRSAASALVKTNWTAEYLHPNNNWESRGIFIKGYATYSNLDREPIFMYKTENDKLIALGFSDEIENILSRLAPGKEINAFIIFNSANPEESFVIGIGAPPPGYSLTSDRNVYANKVVLIEGENKPIPKTRSNVFTFKPRMGSEWVELKYAPDLSANVSALAPNASVKAYVSINEANPDESEVISLNTPPLNYSSPEEIHQKPLKFSFKEIFDRLGSIQSVQEIMRETFLKQKAMLAEWKKTHKRSTKDIILENFVDMLGQLEEAAKVPPSREEQTAEEEEISQLLLLFSHTLDDINDPGSGLRGSAALMAFYKSAIQAMERSRKSIPVHE